MMTKETAKKWLEYQEKGIKPTRFKNRTVVYSDHSIVKELNFKFETYQINLKHCDAHAVKKDPSLKYNPAFICEVIVEPSQHQGGGNFNIKNVLNEIFTWLGFDYDIGLAHEAWEEYEGNWLPALGAGCSLSTQSRHLDLPKKDFAGFLKKYEVAKTLNSKKSKKVINICRCLQEGLKLKANSPNYSFLSFYKVIEIVADDLASSRYCSTDNETAQELVTYGLITKGSQRAKIYYLLTTLQNSFNKDDMVYLADVRNKLAHNEHWVSHEKLMLCQTLAYWAGENFVEILAAKLKQSIS